MAVIGAAILILSGVALACACLLTGLLVYGFISIFWMLDLRHLLVGETARVALALLIGLILIGAGFRLIWPVAIWSIAVLSATLPALVTVAVVLVLDLRSGSSGGAIAAPLAALTLLFPLAVGSAAVASGRWRSGGRNR